MAGSDSFGSKGELTVGDKTYTIHRLSGSVGENLGLCESVLGPPADVLDYRVRPASSPTAAR